MGASLARGTRVEQCNSASMFANDSVYDGWAQVGYRIDSTLGNTWQSQAINASSWASIRVGRPRGWRMRRRGPLSEVERARVKSLRAGGATLQQAAEAVGLSRDALYRHQHRHWRGGMA